MPGMGEYGHEMEIDIMNSFLNNAEVLQSSYEIMPESVCTNLKLFIGGEAFSENDINVSLKRTGLKNMLKRKPKLIDVALQSKRYADKVGFEKVLHDLIKIKLTKDISKSIAKHTYVLTKDIDHDLEIILWRDYNIRTIYEDDLAKHRVVERVGLNQVNRTTFDGKTERINLGGLYLIDKLPFRSLRLYNIINKDKINDSNFSEVVKSITAPEKYLTPEIYLYVSTKGVSENSLMWLNKINAYGTLPESDIPLTPEHLNGIIRQGDLLDFFKPLNYDTTKIKVMAGRFAPFALGKKALGEQEDKLYYPLDKYIYKYDKEVTYPKIAKAVLKFLGEI